MAHFLWDNNFNKEEVCEELADVMLYCINMANTLGVDIEEILIKKLDKNEKKYPVEKSKVIVRNILNFNYSLVVI